MADAKPTQEALDTVYQKVVKKYGNRPNVTGVDVGFRYEGKRRTNEMAVRVHVKEKRPPAALEADEMMPKEIDGVKIDVIEAVYKPHAANAAEPEAVSRKERLDVLQPGISVSHTNVTSGTLGAIVYDRQSGRRGILSNWHVLVGSLAAVPGDPIVQPGRKHGGRAPADRVATLERFMLDRQGDAALALLTAARPSTDAQFESDVRVKQARKVIPGELVEKSGATTDVTSGLVDGVGQYTIDYSVGSRTIAGFKVVTVKDGNPDGEELSAGGDSGALWYARDDNQGVGLHFAGETDPDPKAENALACHLPDVLEQLDITLAPEGPVTPPPPESEPRVDGGATTPGAAATTTTTPAVSGVAPAGDGAQLMLEIIVRLSRLLELSMRRDDNNGAASDRATRRSGSAATAPPPRNRRPDASRAAARRPPAGRQAHPLIQRPPSPAEPPHGGSRQPEVRSRQSGHPRARRGAGRLSGGDQGAARATSSSKAGSPTGRRWKCWWTARCRRAASRAGRCCRRRSGACALTSARRRWRRSWNWPVAPRRKRSRGRSSTNWRRRAASSTSVRRWNRRCPPRPRRSSSSTRSPTSR